MQSPWVLSRLCKESQIECFGYKNYIVEEKSSDLPDLVQAKLRKEKKSCKNPGYNNQANSKK